MPFSLTVDSAAICQYLNWQTQAGDIVAGALSAGVVSGGKISGGAKMRRYRGIGLQESRRPGMNKYAASVKVEATADTKALALNALRGSGSLPFLKWKGGSTQRGWFHQQGQIDTFEWGFSSMEAALECNFGLIADAGAPISGAIVQSPITQPVFTAYDALVTVGGNEYAIQSAKGTLKNNLKQGSHAGARTATHLRDPQFIVPVFEDHEITIQSLMPIPLDPTTDTLATIGMVSVFTLGTNVWTYTYTGLDFDEGNYNMPFKADGETMYETKLIGGNGCLTMS